MLNSKKVLNMLGAIEKGTMRIGEEDYCYAGGSEIRVWNRERYGLWYHEHAKLSHAYQELLEQTGVFGAVNTVGWARQTYDVKLPGNASLHLRAVDKRRLRLVREAIETNTQARGVVDQKKIIEYVSERQNKD